MYNGKILTTEKLQQAWSMKINSGWITHTVMFLSFRTDRSGQTVQTQIRLLLEE